MAHLDRCALPGTVGGGQSSGRARPGSFRLGFGAGRSGYTHPARRRILPLRAAGFLSLGSHLTYSPMFFTLVPHQPLAGSAPLVISRTGSPRIRHGLFIPTIYTGDWAN